jgi:hypothetical protein
MNFSACPDVNHCPKGLPYPGIAVNGAAMTVDVLTPSHDQRSGTPSPPQTRESFAEIREFPPIGCVSL